jgi:hypothetical protein
MKISIKEAGIGIKTIAIMKKIFCKTLGHSFQYNHGSQPTRCYCKRCGIKFKVQFNKPPVHPFELCSWVEEK